MSQATNGMPAAPSAAQQLDSAASTVHALRVEMSVLRETIRANRLSGRKVYFAVLLALITWSILSTVVAWLLFILISAGIARGIESMRSSPPVASPSLRVNPSPRTPQDKMPTVEEILGGSPSTGAPEPSGKRLGAIERLKQMHVEGKVISADDADKMLRDNSDGIRTCAKRCAENPSSRSIWTESFGPENVAELVAAYQRANAEQRP